MATFADLAAQADRLLTQAQQRAGTLSETQAAAVAHELSVAARAGVRIIDDVRDAQLPSASVDAVKVAEAARGRAVAAVHHLRRAMDAAGGRPDVQPPRFGPIPHIRGAARAMRLAEEFLQTHFTQVDGGREPKREAYEIIGASGTARELIAYVGAWYAAIGGLARSVGMSVRAPRHLPGMVRETTTSSLNRAGHCATAAAGVIRGRLGAAGPRSGGLAIAPITASTAVTTPAGWLAACEDALDKLHTQAPAAWRAERNAAVQRVIAGAQASMCAHAAILTRQLAARAEQIDARHGPAVAHRLRTSSDAFAAASDAWHRTTWHARGLVTADTTLPAGPSFALDAVSALGRAATEHDEWAPGLRPGEPRSPAALATGPVELTRMVTATRAIGTLLAAVAEDRFAATTPDPGALIDACRAAAGLTRHAATILPGHQDLADLRSRPPTPVHAGPGQAAPGQAAPVAGAGLSAPSRSALEAALGVAGRTGDTPNPAPTRRHGDRAAGPRQPRDWPRRGPGGAHGPAGRG